ncbi:MAG: hypothetical protein WBL54_08390, partial [Nitrososphaeraceae archaeon]
DFIMVLQGFVTELMNSKISLFVVIEPIGNCLCAICNSYAIYNRLNILVPMSQNIKSELSVTAEFKYFASLFGN